MSRHDAILLPGGVMPARLAYPDLVGKLNDRANARFKELEIYETDIPLEEYSLDVEVDSMLRLADDAGFDRFHLVGYSAGGAIALKATETHAHRLLSLTLMEPAWAGNDGLSAEESKASAEVLAALRLPESERMAAFVRAQLAPGVEPPPPPPGPPPPWMASRVERMPVIDRLFMEGRLDVAALSSFAAPVLFVLGGQSNPAYYGNIARRLAGAFPDFTLETFEERHHFDPPHRSEPDRVAEVLIRFWDRATNASR